MRILACIFLTLLFSFSLFAQTTRPEPINFDDLRQISILNPRIGGFRGFDNRYEGVRGNPYLLENWQKGKILFHQKEDYSTSLDLNIDLEKQQLYFRLETGQMGAVPAGKIKGLQLLEGEEVIAVFRTLVRGQVEENDSEESAFYEVVYEGEQFTLLKLTLKPLIKADFKGAYSPNRRYDEYVAEETYWLREGEGAFTKVKLKRKALEKALPKQARRIKQLWDKYDQGEGEEATVVKILEQIEQ